MQQAVTNATASVRVRPRYEPLMFVGTMETHHSRHRQRRGARAVALQRSNASRGSRAHAARNNRMIGWKKSTDTGNKGTDAGKKGTDAANKGPDNGNNGTDTGKKGTGNGNKGSHSINKGTASG